MTRLFKFLKVAFLLYAIMATLEKLTNLSNKLFRIATNR